MRFSDRLGRLTVRVGWVLFFCGFSVRAFERTALAGDLDQRAPSKVEETRKIELGRDLRARVGSQRSAKSRRGWTGPGVQRAPCAGCHHQSGPGGGGSLDKNIEIVTAGERSETPGFYYTFSFNYGPDGFQYRIGDQAQSPNRNRRVEQRELAQLTRIHPGFRDGPSVVLHRYGNDGDYRVCARFVTRTAVRPRRAVIPAQSRAAFRERLDRPRARCGDRSRGQAQASRFTASQRAGQPTRGRPYRPLRLEGPDRKPARVQPLGRSGRVGT